MSRLATVLLLLTSAGVAQPEAPKPLTVSFDGGPAIELHTESSAGKSPLSTAGSVEVGAGHDAHRFVLDREDKVIFGYYIEVLKAGQGAVAVRIKPFDREKIRQESWYLRQKGAGDVPTLAATREFPRLEAGDEVQVDIFYNAGTGEKIYDVIKVANPQGPPRKTSKPAGDQFSLQGFRVQVNGKTIRDTSESWMIGGGLVIFMPGRGDYYFGLAPCSETPCRPAAWVDHNVLRFYAGNELVEVIAKANILQTSDFRTLWMYHDAESKAGTAGGQVEFTCGDGVESLIRYKRARQE
jgi:hypothetical protein